MWSQRTFYDSCRLRVPTSELLCTLNTKIRCKVLKLALVSTRFTCSFQITRQSYLCRRQTSGKLKNEDHAHMQLLMAEFLPTFGVPYVYAWRQSCDFAYKPLPFFIENWVGPGDEASSAVEWLFSQFTYSSAAGKRLRVKHPLTKWKISISSIVTVDRMSIDPTVNSDVFCPTMETVATVLGEEVVKVQVSTMQVSAMEPSKWPTWRWRPS